MLPFLMQLNLGDAMHEYSELTTSFLEGLENLSDLKQEDIEIGVSEKEEVYREDKLTLYHFKPLVETPLKIPVLLVYTKFMLMQLHSFFVIYSYSLILYALHLL